MPIYRRGDPGAHPYLIVVSDPRPSLWAGKTTIHGFGVDAPIPTVVIPLAGDDAFVLALGPIYHQTFASLPAYGRRVDYAQLPPRPHTYSAEDQARIRSRMAAVGPA